MTVSWGTTKTYYKSHYALSFLIMGGKVGLGVSKRTGYSVLEEGNYIQQWFSHENPDAPGNYQSFSCSVMYNATTTWINETDVLVQSYYGDHNWGKGNNSASFFDELNIEYLEEGPWQPFEVENNPDETFIVGYERDISDHSS